MRGREGAGAGTAGRYIYAAALRLIRRKLTVRKLIHHHMLKHVELAYPRVLTVYVYIVM